MTIEEFPAFAREHRPTIQRALLDGTFQPQSLRRKSPAG